MGQKCSREEARVNLEKTVGIPLEEERKDEDKTVENRHCFLGLVSSTWLKAVINHGVFHIDNELSEYKNNAVKLSEIFKDGYSFDKNSTCFKVKVVSLKKNINFSLLRDNEDPFMDIGKSIYDVLESQQQFLKKSYERFLSSYKNCQTKRIEKTKTTNNQTWNDLRNFLENTFHIPVIFLNPDTESVINGPINKVTSIGMNPYIDVLAILESTDDIYVIERYLKYSLNDALLYSPSLLGRSHANFRFLLYQLMNLFLTLRKNNMNVNTDLRLQDVHLQYNTLLVATSIFDCVAVKQNVSSEDEQPPFVKFYNGRETDLRDSCLILTHTLNEYTNAWSVGRISNFDYLMILNKLAGRRFGEPTNHPIFPWVTDFSSFNGGYRNLKRSKFRLNKGDFQLDATYNGGYVGSGFIQHHVSDVLSDITYYIYHARKTPKEILCNYVRSRWVPDEYPSSIERMYDWTPDECIPEFFFDPEMFRSIHDDLSDLKFPNWINCPEEFVEYHYKILESPYISENLHHWIDLMFGYKLEGKAAKREKNVHLSLVDGHKELKNYGVVRLFSFNHPKKKVIINEPFESLESTSMDELDGKAQDISTSWEYVDLTNSMKLGQQQNDITNKEINSDREDFSIRRNRRGSELHQQKEAILNTTTQTEDEQTNTPTHKYHVHDPGKHAFSNIMDQTEKILVFELLHNLPSETGIGNFEFGRFDDNKESRKVKGDGNDEFHHLDRETKLFLCLLIEIVCHHFYRTRTNIPDIDQRLKENRKVLELNTQVPGWIRESVENVVSRDKDKRINIEAVSLHYLTISPNKCFNYPSYYNRMYEFLSHVLQIAHSYEEYHDVFQRIENVSKDLPKLLERLDQEAVELLVLYLNPLFERPVLQVPMFLFIFPSLSLAVGPIRSQSVFLKGYQILMDQFHTSVKDITILMPNFLSYVVSGFGHDYFLRHFMGLLLDILSIQKNQSPPSSSESNNLEKTISMSNLNSENNESVLNRESLLSFELSPTLATDSISLSNFNLELMFSEGDHHGSPEGKELGMIEDIEKRSEQQYERRSTNSSSNSETLNLQVVSTQEIGNIINVESVSQSVPNFSLDYNNAPQNYQGIQGHAALQDTIIKRHSPPETQDSPLSSVDDINVSESPFTILVDENVNADDGLTREHSFTEISETLEVPNDLSNETLTSPNTSPQAVENEQTFNIEEQIGRKAIHGTIVHSLKWFIPWLGPKIATEYIAEPLLNKMGKIFIETPSTTTNSDTDVIDDLLENISSHIECLVEMAVIYGDKIVIYLYLPHVGQLIENAITSSSVSISLGSNLVSAVHLLDTTIKRIDKDIISTYFESFSITFFQPLIRLLSIVKPFSTGVIVKEFLSRKMIDIMCYFCSRLKRELAQESMKPLLQQFFSCFDGIYTIEDDEGGSTNVVRKYSLLCDSVRNTPECKIKLDNNSKSVTSTSEGEFTTEGEFVTDGVKRILTNISIDDVLENDQVERQYDLEKFTDIYDTFSPALAYHAYVQISRILGGMYVSETLYNYNLVHQLFTKYDRMMIDADGKSDEEGQQEFKRSSKWLQTVDPLPNIDEVDCERSTWQHLEGNWLKNWKDSTVVPTSGYYFASSKLQTYAGHSSAIRDLYVADNEHYFLSASRDKTVKLWLLKNHGNGTAHLGCSGTYDKHERAVFSVQGIEAKRWVVSSDGVVNVWDPICLETIHQYSCGRGHGATCMRTLPQPSVCLAVATTEGQMRIYDVRQKSFAQEWKLLNQQNAGMVRSMCVNDKNTYINVGFSSGCFSIIDLRAGTLKTQLKIHEGDIMHMETVPGYGFISSSGDTQIKFWMGDGKLNSIYKGSNEYINSLVFNKHQLLWTTSSGKLVIHDNEKILQYRSYRINQDLIKRSLSKMMILPTNRLFLFGADNGNIVLSA